MNNSFKTWIETRLDKKARAQLMVDLLSFMSDDAIADMIDELATQLNERGYDWSLYREGDEQR